MAIKISIMNQKGGVAKSTTVQNLAMMLADLGKKVLICDLDQQNDQIKLAPIKGRADRDKSFAGILLKNYSAEECITCINSNLDLIQSGGKALESFNSKFKGSPSESIIIKESLKGLEDNYDYYIIDSSPTFSLIHQNILAYADYVISPCDMDYLSLSATRSTIHLIEHLTNKLTNDIKMAKFLGVIPIRFDSRRNLDNLILNDLYSLEDNKLLLEGTVFTPIRESSKLKTAVAKKKSLKEAFPNDKVTLEIESIAKELINKFESTEKVSIAEETRTN
jgi:chromosome partitioning protein